MRGSEGMRVWGVLLLSGVLASLGAEQGIGMQADMLGRGFCYRLIASNGLGGEIVGHGWMFIDEDDSLSYRTGIELRLLKLFNFRPRIRIHVGAGVGGWQQRQFRYVYLGPPSYDTELRLVTQRGTSIACLCGVDWVILRTAEGRGISIMPELQFGYYTRPDDSYPETISASTVSTFISPGAGIGFRYIW